MLRTRDPGCQQGPKGVPTPVAAAPHSQRPAAAQTGEAQASAQRWPPPARSRRERRAWERRPAPSRRPFACGETQGRRPSPHRPPSSPLPRAPWSGSPVSRGRPESSLGPAASAGRQQRRLQLACAQLPAAARSGADPALGERPPPPGWGKERGSGTPGRSGELKCAPSGKGLGAHAERWGGSAAGSWHGPQDVGGVPAPPPPPAQRPDPGRLRSPLSRELLSGRDSEADGRLSGLPGGRRRRSLNPEERSLPPKTQPAPWLRSRPFPAAPPAPGQASSPCRPSRT